MWFSHVTPREPASRVTKVCEILGDIIGVSYVLFLSSTAVEPLLLTEKTTNTPQGLRESSVVVAHDWSMEREELE